MTEQDFNKWVLELCTQEYKGHINDLRSALEFQRWSL
jgi:hypothetical protein